jgi:hypothetical protein
VQNSEEGHSSRRLPRRAAQQARTLKKPKIEAAKVEKQRSNLLLDNSEQSSDGWSDSDGELVIDTPTVAPIVKESGRKKKKQPPAAVAKKAVEEDVCDEREGKIVGFIPAYRHSLVCSYGEEREGEGRRSGEEGGTG